MRSSLPQMMLGKQCWVLELRASWTRPRVTLLPQTTESVEELPAQLPAL